MYRNENVYLHFAGIKGLLKHRQTLGKGELCDCKETHLRIYHSTQRYEILWQNELLKTPIKNIVKC